VKEQLDRNRVLVEALRDALLERDERIGDEILEVLRQAEAGQAAAGLGCGRPVAGRSGTGLEPAPAVAATPGAPMPPTPTAGPDR
jgi:hypothetical protein